MKPGQERCDHCGKWVPDCSLVIPEHIPKEAQDGTIAVCEKCVYNKKYSPAYWMAWHEKRAEK